MIETFDVIEQLVRSGKHKMALHRIRNLKIQRLNPSLRLQLSDWYYRCGSPSEALKIMGKEEDEILSGGSLAAQARLAFMLSYFDVHHAAERILNRVKRLFVKFPDIQPTFSSTLFRYSATIHLRTYNYAHALEDYEQAIHVGSSSDSFYQRSLLQLGVADCLDRLGASHRAIDIASKIIRSTDETQTVLHGISLQARGEYYLRQGDLKAAKRDFDSAFRFFSSDSRSHDYAFLLKWSGALSFLEGDLESAEEKLSKTLNILDINAIRPSVILEVLYWRVRINPSRLADPLYRSILTHPVSSPYGFALGRNKIPNEKIEPWIESLRPPTINNCHDVWMIDENFCSHMYEVIAFNELHSCLDLRSGIIWRRGKVADWLSPLKLQLVGLLFSAGPFGINQWSLIENLYPGEWNELPSLLRRLENLIHECNSSGFNIYRNSGRVHIRHHSKISILLPMNQKWDPLLPFLKSTGPTLTRNKMVEALGCAESTAKYWLKKWQSENKIIPTGIGRNRHYNFL